MTRLIDVDALLEVVKVIGNKPLPDVRTLKDLELAIVNTYHAILNEITNAPTVEREGWVSVPIEPTEEMLKEAQREQGDHGSYIEWVAYGYADDVIATYKAMISAAPKE